MELVIKIPDGYDITRIQNGSIASQVILNAVKNGTPLNKIRAEIMMKDGLEEALEIIDKYKAEP